MVNDWEKEAQERRREILAGLLDGAAWREVIAPTLAARLAELERRTMSAKTLEDVRTFQGAYQALSQMLQDPKGFFGEAGGGRHAAALAVDEETE